MLTAAPDGPASVALFVSLSPPTSIFWFSHVEQAADWAAIACLPGNQPSLLLQPPSDHTCNLHSTVCLPFSVPIVLWPAPAGTHPRFISLHGQCTFPAPYKCSPQDPLHSWPTGPGPFLASFLSQRRACSASVCPSRRFLAPDSFLLAHQPQVPARLFEPVSMDDRRLDSLNAPGGACTATTRCLAHPLLSAAPFHLSVAQLPVPHLQPNLRVPWCITSRV